MQTEASSTKPRGEGFLPIKVLPELILGWFEQTSTTLRNEVQDEMEYRGLDRGIGYRIEAVPISSASSLDNGRKIWLHENFLETLWCVGYTLLAMYEKVVMPAFEQPGAETEIDVSRNNRNLTEAYRVLDAGLSLVEGFDIERFEGIPQPKNPNHESDQLVEKANNVFVAGGAYLLMHEVGHQFFDHPSTEAKDRPLPEKVTKADEYALHWVKRGMANKDKDVINAIGVMAVMTTFMILDEVIDPNAELDRPDMRYRKALYELDILGEPLWILASLSGVLYAGEKKIPITHLPADEIESYRDVFANTMDQLGVHFTAARTARHEGRSV